MILLGFWRGTVEMKKARLRALTHQSTADCADFDAVEMKKARLRALTHFVLPIANLVINW